MRSLSGGIFAYLGLGFEPFGDSSEYLYLIGWDPKDGDLYVIRMKSEETLMEVRRDANVQIVLQS